MDGWKQEHIDEYLKRIGAVGSGGWARPGVQESKKNIPRKNHNRPASPSMDDPGYEQFCATITILVSDKRRRDLDGALATLLDSNVAARRQLEGYPAYLHKRGDGSQGDGGSANSS